MLPSMRASPEHKGDEPPPNATQGGSALPGTGTGGIVQPREDKQTGRQLRDRRSGRHSHNALPFTVKDILWWMYLYPIRGVAGILPPALVRNLTPLFTPAFQALTLKRKRIVRQRMATAFGLQPGDPKVRREARRYIRNAVRRALDDLILNRLVVPGAGLAGGIVNGITHLETALTPGRGAIVATGHFYANRLGKRHMAELGYSMMSTRHSRPPDMMMGRFGKRSMQPRYVDFLRGIILDEISPTDRDCSLRMLQRLRNNGLVNVHFDASFSRDRVVLPFLGRKRSFATGILDIARLTGASIVPMLCLGNSTSFRVEFSEPIIPQRSDDATRFVGEYLPVIATGIESDIRDHPDEWELWTRI
jgi:lauroyl/myristoyl acyltransferase